LTFLILQNKARREATRDVADAKKDPNLIKAKLDKLGQKGMHLGISSISLPHAVLREGWEEPQVPRGEAASSRGALHGLLEACKGAGAHLLGVLTEL
jgi:hypothetical protein